VRTKLGTNSYLASLLLVVVLAACLPLSAHHGNAAYDTEKTVTVKGVVTEYIWANPHVFVKVDAKDDSGNTLHWVIEAQNLVSQSELGWTNVMFKPGDQVVIDVTPAKNGRPIGRFKGRIVINGQEFKPLR
jgi:predicted RNA-binding protein (virulence factor B family)